MMLTVLLTYRVGMPAKPCGEALNSKPVRNRNEGRRGRMANMSSANAGNATRMGGLSSTDIFGGLMGGF